MDDLEDIQKGEPIYLGVLGSRQDLVQNQIIDTIIMPILERLGRTPDQLILPAEGTTSIFISDWADGLKIPTQIYESDWNRHQRRAKIYRDSRIQKESTHFLIFLNKRSTFNEKLAERLVKQGKTVFTVSYNNTFTQLTGPSLAQQEAPGNKRGTGKEQGLLQWMQSTSPGSQCLLIDP